MKFLPLLAFFALFACLTSCIPDGVSTLTPEVPEVVEEPAVTTNFSVNGFPLEINHGYLFKVSENEAGETQHHLVLTTAEVREGEAFSGNSEAITITLNAAVNSDLVGEYPLAGDGNEVGTATIGRHYRNLQFSSNSNFEQGYFDRGAVQVSREGDDYVVSLQFSTSYGSTKLEGTFQGEIVSSDLTQHVLADQSLFQGSNQLKYGESAVDLNYAYLVEYGTTNSGTRRYRLYLSEEDIAPDAVTLTGRSDLIFFYVSEQVVQSGGQYTFRSDGYDYLSAFRGLVEKGYYCKNMDFRQNSADVDVPVETGGIDLEVEGEEIVIAFNGEAITGIPTTGLFRGPLILLD